VLHLRASLAFVFFAALVAPSAFSANSHSHPASTSSHTKHHGHKKATPKLHGQQAIDSGRVTEIQQALIRAHYYSGEANGQWDAATKAAMLKYQGDHGWQTKLTPDSRALKKLGLGPDYSNAINAKNASFVVPPAEGTTPPAQSAGFAEAAGVSR
jgi:peptidoglycan hydrolase-like protein with peptidoglycan-binding domain